MDIPGHLIGEAAVGMFDQPSDHRGGQRVFAMYASASGQLQDGTDDDRRNVPWHLKAQHQFDVAQYCLA